MTTNAYSVISSSLAHVGSGWVELTWHDRKQNTKLTLHKWPRNGQIKHQMTVCVIHISFINGEVESRVGLSPKGFVATLIFAQNRKWKHSHQRELFLVCNLYLCESTWELIDRFRVIFKCSTMFWKSFVQRWWYENKEDASCVIKTSLHLLWLVTKEQVSGNSHNSWFIFDVQFLRLHRKRDCRCLWIVSCSRVEQHRFYSSEHYLIC